MAFPYRPSEGTRSGLPVLTLYTKPQCSLCDIAKERLKDLLPRVHFIEVDIDKPGNEVWKLRYRYDIPVFHLNGKFLMKHKADPALLARHLAQIEGCK